MLIDSQREFCTFRTTTTDPEYKPVLHFAHPSIWRLDNSMQDADTRIVREFLTFLNNLD